MREWRMRHGLTQHALAELLGVRELTVSRWERNYQSPPGRLLELALEHLAERLPPSLPPS